MTRARALPRVREPFVYMDMDMDMYLGAHILCLCQRMLVMQMRAAPRDLSMSNVSLSTTRATRAHSTSSSLPKPAPTAPSPPTLTSAPNLKSQRTHHLRTSRVGAGYLRTEPATHLPCATMELHLAAAGSTSCASQ